VAVLVDTSTNWSRDVFRGATKYVQKHRPWHLFIEPHGAQEDLLLPRGWQGDGIIARVTSKKMALALQARGLPVVNVSAIQTRGPDFPRVASDVAASAKIAVEYFLERGFKHFGYLSLQGLEYVTRQRDSFVNAVQAAGFSCELHGVQTHAGAQAPDWNLRMDNLGAWLHSLPKPVALLTWAGGREIIHACHHVGIRVPEEVALLSGSDDLLCETSQVPISAIKQAAEKIGYGAAELLDRMMRGRRIRKQPKLIAPVGVITRQSTETLAIADPIMVKAVIFIRENINQPIQVGEVARHAGVSRRSLERKFIEIMGRTPADHIRRLHLDRAKKLLVETDNSIPEVAEASGFGSPEYMAYFFRLELSITPLRYRREARGR